MRRRTTGKVHTTRSHATSINRSAVTNLRRYIRITARMCVSTSTTTSPSTRSTNTQSCVPNWSARNSQYITRRSQRSRYRRKQSSFVAKVNAKKSSPNMECSKWNRWIYDIFGRSLTDEMEWSFGSYFLSQKNIINIWIGLWSKTISK